MSDWNASLGAIFDGTATMFRVWAPDRQSVDLLIEERAGAGDRQSRDIRPMARGDCGHWIGRFTDIGPGARYRYRLDGADGAVFPDPASRSQPHGVHGPSEVVDPARFEWTDGAWQPPALRDLVVYELHVGTFTPHGTYRAAVDRLAYLAGLGVTAVELMPVGDFPGARNWGYDGVAIFAPARCYGTPDDLRAFVDAAHQHGLAVHLDVVYNHLGPDGAYANAFSPYYFSSAHQTAWGAGVNLDGPHSQEVRRFFVENALHWVREYHVDGLRIDATHAMRDDSRPHLLAEMSAAIRSTAAKPVILTAEDHRNLAHMVKPVDEGGFGLDAVWADDFHHQVRVHTAGDRDGYYADYTGSVSDLARTIRDGWFFTGQHSKHLGIPLGTSPAGIPPQQFIFCIQNHDQIGNRADGARLHHQVDPATYRAVSALLLLAPQTPLLFMGQEWGSSSPFQFFTDHHEALGRLVTEGRRREFRVFDAFGNPREPEAIPDPQHPDTFERSRLDWGELSRQPHAGILQMYRRLLTLRRSCSAIRNATCGSYDVHTPDAHTLALTLTEPVRPEDGATGPAGTLHLVVRLSGRGQVTVPLPGNARTVLFTTEDEAFLEDPAPISSVCDPPRTDSRSGNQGLLPWRIEFSRPGAVLIASGPEDVRERG